MEELSPRFNDLTIDIQEIMRLSENPVLLSVLLFKLAEERKKTNELLEKIYDKYDRIMLEMKTRQQGSLQVGVEKNLEILPEQDRKIMDLAQINGSTTAEEVQKALDYKGKNAACQRLNLLANKGFLKKARSGKQVLYLISP
jgi:predicted HTH transcriptional regulator